MKLEETIQALFNLHPEFYNERWQALDHLFCGHGSGNHWVNGQLISTAYPLTEIHIPLGKDGKAAINKEVIDRRFIELKEEFLRKEQAKRIELFEQGFPKKEVDFLATANEDAATDFAEQMLNLKGAKRKIIFHPINSASPLSNIPEDVQPDWLEGIKETVELILIHGHGGNSQFWTNRQHEDHIYWTKELKRMSERFNQRYG